MMEMPIVRFSVTFADVDEQGGTVLSAAPVIAGVPGGMLRASR
jgi:hypothetical protein